MAYLNRQESECTSWAGNSTRVALTAGTGSAGPLPIITTPLSEPLNVVSAGINTQGFANPGILLTFTGTISLPLGISVSLNFQLIRSNGTSTIPVGSTYTFSTLVTVLESESFAFQFFDTGLMGGVYTYTEQLSTNSIIDVTPGLTINNATLSALAVDFD